MRINPILESAIINRRKVLVGGLGLSGCETLNLLLDLGLSAVAVEKQEEAAFFSASRYAQKVLDLRRRGVEVNFSTDGEEIAKFCSDVALSILSPGISMESALAGALRRRGIPILSELELGLSLLSSICPEMRTVIVTGSNGKSTTVSLLHHFLRIDGRNSMLVGNIGNPLVSEVSRIKEKKVNSPVLIVEASSYQLEICSDLRAHIAILLNISANHLERHGSIDRYREIKSNVFSGQDGGCFALVNNDDEDSASLYPFLKARKGRFGMEGGGSNKDDIWAGISFRPSFSDSISLRVMGQSESFDLRSCRLIGLHNRYNAAAAVSAAGLLGCSISAIEEGIRTFEPLEHRIEIISGPEGRIFINDSKSTSMSATRSAFLAIAEAFPGKKITLLMGGQAKAGSWTPLLSTLRDNSSRLGEVVVFGGDKKLIASHLQAWDINSNTVSTLREAVSLAAEAGEEIVLLSPGCASFDEFSNFEERGKEFKRIINALAPVSRQITDA